MARSVTTPVFLTNRAATLRIEAEGGAITAFQLKDIPVNPLSFAFSQHDMPANNRNGAPYRGHFACIGRWGPPSPGEISAGMPDHGDFANISWNISHLSDRQVNMHARSDREDLTVHRQIIFDENQAVFFTTENIFNHHHRGRLFNIVQHPTIAAPFLSARTKVFCNADKGFHYEMYRQTETCSAKWPTGVYPDGHTEILQNSDGITGGVHSFTVEKNEESGWLLAYSPEHSLLLGYVWPRKHYPWINIWRDFHGQKIRYRGLEFGTTGIHRPFRDLLNGGSIRIFGESVLEYIDAGESVNKKYLCFLHHVSETITDIQTVDAAEDIISIHLSGGLSPIRIPLSPRVLFADEFPTGEDVKKMI